MDEDKHNVDKERQQTQNEINKLDTPMIGADGNIFAQLGIASRALRENGQSDKVSEMSARVMSSDSYNKALSIICEYVNPVEKSEKLKIYER